MDAMVIGLAGTAHQSEPDLQINALVNECF
jgi:hypothetical protein